MGLLLLPRAWAQQPPSPVAAGPGSGGLAAGLRGAWLFGTPGALDVVRNIKATHVGVSGHGVGKLGPVSTYAGGGTSYTTLRPGPNVGGLTDWTIAVYAATTWTPGYAGGQAIYAERGPTGNDILKVNFGGDALPPTASQSTWGLVYRNDGGTLLQVGTAETGPAVTDGNPHLCVCTKKGTLISLYVDGKLYKTATFGSTSDAFTDAVESRAGGDAGDSSAGYVGDLAFVYTWSRALSVAEVQQLQAEPYAPFAPRQPYRWSQALLARASTLLHLTNTAADPAVTAGAGTKHKADWDPGAASTLRNINTTAGPVVPLQLTASSVAGTNGAALSWYSPRLEAVTIAGAITASLWTVESATTVNAAPTMRVERCSADGTVLSVIVSETVNHGAGEMAATAGGATDSIAVTAANVTDTTLTAGDRLRITLWVDDAADQAGTGTMAAGNAQFYVNGPVGQAGQARIAFTETLTEYTPPSVSGTYTADAAVPVTTAIPTPGVTAGVSATVAPGLTYGSGGYGAGSYGGGGGELAVTATIPGVVPPASAAITAAVLPVTVAVPGPVLPTGDLYSDTYADVYGVVPGGPQTPPAVLAYAVIPAPGLAIAVNPVRVSATTVIATPGLPDLTPPSVPTNLAQTGQTTNTVSLSWTASTDNVAVAFYEVTVEGPI